MFLIKINEERIYRTQIPPRKYEGVYFQIQIQHSRSSDFCCVLKQFQDCKLFFSCWTLITVLILLIDYTKRAISNWKMWNYNVRKCTILWVIKMALNGVKWCSYNLPKTNEFPWIWLKCLFDCVRKILIIIVHKYFVFRMIQSFYKQLSIVYHIKEDVV